MIFKGAPTEQDAKLVILTLVVIFALFEIWAVVGEGWTISDVFWAYKQNHPWLKLALGVVFFGLWGHLALEWGRFR